MTSWLSRSACIDTTVGSVGRTDVLYFCITSAAHKPKLKQQATHFYHPVTVSSWPDSKQLDFSVLSTTLGQPGMTVKVKVHAFLYFVLCPSVGLTGLIYGVFPKHI